MDLVSRYWDENTNRVAARYLNSAFIGYATSEDILESALNPINIVSGWTKCQLEVSITL